MRDKYEKPKLRKFRMEFKNVFLEQFLKLGFDFSDFHSPLFDSTFGYKLALSNDGKSVVHLHPGDLLSIKDVLFGA